MSVFSLPDPDGFSLPATYEGTAAAVDDLCAAMGAEFHSRQAKALLLALLERIEALEAYCRSLDERTAGLA